MTILLGHLPEASTRALTRSAVSRCAAVILLHGSAGLHPGTGMKNLAVELSQHGYFVCLTHYFEYTGTFQSQSREDIDRNFNSWRTAAKSAVTYVSQHPHADPSRRPDLRP